jgi:hypothetical protein
MKTCEGMDADPPSDTCEKAKKQLTALILNLCSDRLRGDIEVDVAVDGCSSTSVGDLIGEIASLVSIGDCTRAADCAAAVNEGEGLTAGGGAGAPSTTSGPARVPRPRWSSPRLERTDRR